MAEEGCRSEVRKTDQFSLPTGGDTDILTPPPPLEGLARSWERTKMEGAGRLESECLEVRVL